MLSVKYPAICYANCRSSNAAGMPRLIRAPAWKGGRRPGPDRREGTERQRALEGRCPERRILWGEMEPGLAGVDRGAWTAQKEKEIYGIMIQVVI